jgi:hypothetical protein
MRVRDGSHAGWAGELITELSDAQVAYDRSRPRSTQSPAAADARTQCLASARTITAGQAFVQNLRHGHYAISAELPVHDRAHV